MRSVILEVVSEDEIREVMQAVIAKAKEGNLPAARLILSYAVGNPPAGYGDEAAPTGARPGTESKVDVLAYRHVRGLPLHANGDGGPIDLS
jgi:hypothetical protein